MPEARRAGELVGGRYRLVRRVGSGAFGAVYEAHDERIQRRTALKFLHQSLVGDDDARARFEREARSAGSIEHENVVAVTDFGHDDQGTPFLVMEFLDGEDLASLLGRCGRVVPTRAVELALQACRGLSAAHARGIVHRDLKPENLFVARRADSGDRIKLLDFGIAKLQRPVAETDPNRSAGVTLGTAHYMSPEQARGATGVDARTDVYALGAVLYEMLSGTRAHPGDTYNDVVFHLLTKRPASLRANGLDLPQGLAAVVERAMATDPADRFADADELAAALEPFAQAPRTAPPAGATQTARTEAPREPARPARAAARVGVASVVLASLLVLAVVSESSGAADSPAAPSRSPIPAAPAATSAPTAQATPAAPSTPTPPPERSSAPTAKPTLSPRVSRSTPSLAAAPSSKASPAPVTSSEGRPHLPFAKTNPYASPAPQ